MMLIAPAIGGKMSGNENIKCRRGRKQPSQPWDGAGHVLTLLTRILKSRNTLTDTWSWNQGKEQKIMWNSRPENRSGGCWRRHFPGRWSLLHARFSWSRIFWWLTFRAKATCEIADRGRIAKEAERKILVEMESYPILLPGVPYGLGRGTVNPTAKITLYFKGWDSCHSWTI